MCNKSLVLSDGEEKHRDETSIPRSGPAEWENSPSLRKQFRPWRYAQRLNSRQQGAATYSPVYWSEIYQRTSRRQVIKN